MLIYITSLYEPYEVIPSHQSGRKPFEKDSYDITLYNWDFLIHVCLYVEVKISHNMTIICVVRGLR